MFIVYQTTCLIDGKRYIGVHKQDKDDSYLGSGKHLLRAIKKHGKENFVRETLFEFSTRTQAYNKEAELVTEEVVADRNYYNMRLGGRGGKAWTFKKDREQICKKMSQNWNRSEERLERLRTQNIGRKLSEEHVKALREGHKKQRKVYKITDGEETYTLTLYDFCAMKGLNPKSANQCVWKRGSYKGWTFS
ncbi:homing endonuclease [Synechococcus phage ME01]